MLDYPQLLLVIFVNIRFRNDRFFIEIYVSAIELKQIKSFYDIRF